MTNIGITDIEQKELTSLLDYSKAYKKLCIAAEKLQNVTNQDEICLLTPRRRLNLHE